MKWSSLIAKKMKKCLFYEENFWVRLIHSRKMYKNRSPYTTSLTLPKWTNRVRKCIFKITLKILVCNFRSVFTNMHYFIVKIINLKFSDSRISQNGKNTLNKLVQNSFQPLQIWPTPKLLCSIHFMGSKFSWGPLKWLQQQQKRG